LNLDMEKPGPSNGYSPVARLWLEVEGRVISLAQVAPEWIIPQSPEHLPPCEGVVAVSVDGRPAHRRRVSLVSGMSADSTFVPIQDQAEPGRAAGTG